MKRALLAAPLAAPLALLLAACGSSGPTSGTVVAKDHADGYVIFMPVCTLYGKYGCQVWAQIPMDQPATWTLTLRNCPHGGNCATGDVDVDPADWAAVKIGDTWPKAGKP